MQANYTVAQDRCAEKGAFVFAARDRGEFDFVKAYAAEFIRSDIWMGVSKSFRDYYYDDSDPEARTPLFMHVSEDKSYADGEEYVEGTSFDFDFSGSWSDSCINLRASVK